MIFKKQSKITPTSANNSVHRTWKDKFRLQMYRRNYDSITERAKYEIDRTDAANMAAVNLIESMRRNQWKLQQGQADSDNTPIDQRYCSFIPLQKSLQFDDEIVNTFLYLRGLKEDNNLLEQDNFYAEVRKFLNNCKEANRIMDGWKICLRKFVVGLDILQRIEIFIEFQKRGTSCLESLHKKYGRGVLKDIFIKSVMLSNRYFERQARLNKTWKISLELNDKITEANISKTMKMLYCSICLIYDCGKHKLEEFSHDKDYHYVSPKTQILEPVHICRAISLLNQLRNVGAENGQDGCSQLCFKKLSLGNYDEFQLKKSKIISPMIESIIKMGVQMFSYSPCLIKTLFPPSAPRISRLSCSVIFMYLIEQANLNALLDYKVHDNEFSYLMKQSLQSGCNRARGNLGNSIVSKKRKRKNENNEEFKYQQIAICLHCYIGDESFDLECSNCACSRRGFCLPECQCGPNCSIMIQGCSCRSKQQCQSIKCPCYKAKTECIPNICHNCFPSDSSAKKNQCKNDQILRGSSKLIKVGISKIPQAGFGAFAGENIKKGSLVSTYCGEVLDQEMQNIRQTLKNGQSFYNFACFEGSIDARYMGNKTRFINHGNESDGKTNLVSLNMFSQGQECIGLYATRDIKEGEELLFDYDGEGEIAKVYSEVYSFLKKEVKTGVKIERTLPCNQQTN